LILEYDRDYREKAEQAEIEAINSAYDIPITNRIEQKGGRNVSPVLRLSGVEKVCLGELEFTTSESNGTVCSLNQWSNTALFTHFFLCGWNPSGIETQNTDYIYLNSLALNGKYTSIPDYEVLAPIRFTTREMMESHLVENPIPITLTVDGDYREKIHFSSNESEQKEWIQINRVYLYDIWGEFEKLLSDPRIIERLSEEELLQRKAELKATLIDDCPEGMCFLAVDYESGDNISVTFYSKRWLEDTPRYKNHGLGIIATPEQPTGKLGLKLKTTIIHEPLPPNTKTIEVELFCYHMTIAKKEIVI
jgi:hypothetical protein